MNQIVPSIATPEPADWRVSYRGSHIDCTADGVGAASAELVQRLGAPTLTDYPRPVSLAPAPAVRAAAMPVQPAPIYVPTPRPSASPVRGSTVDGTGQVRSLLDEAGAREGGFSPKRTLYARGTMVVGVGVENATAFRAEFDAMPRVGECVDGFLTDFDGEERRDMVAGNDVRMDKLGRLVLPGGDRLIVNERAFTPLCSRLGFGGGEYLSQCWPELRAINVNRWMDSYQRAHAVAVETAKSEGKDAPDPRTMVLRTRNADEAREVYGAVSGGYTAFDADKVAKALALAMPEDARLRVQYDGFRARFDVMFHSTVEPEDYVCGEFFRAGITIRTDDTGGGSLRGHTFVEQNLCLNLIIIDKAVQPLFALRHMGSVEKLAEEFRAGLGAAQDTLSHFMRAWGFARRDDLVVTARQRGELDEVETADAPLITLADYFAGFANGIIERELVPLRARGGATVQALKQMYLDDASGDGPSAGRVTRAGVVNAFTRYAHRVEADPFRAATVEAAAASLLWEKRGKLPEIPFAMVTL